MLIRAIFIIGLLFQCHICYLQTELSRLEVIKRTAIDSTLNEISGLAYWRGYFVGFNDSGGKPWLYIVDSSGSIVQTIAITNAENYDWEDITLDENYIYIGDFGNNYGDRKNLRIYKVATQNIPLPKDQKHVEVTAEKLRFCYREQKSRKANPHNHDFDAESLVVYGGKLHLFAKEWKSKQTKHYVLNPNKKRQKLKMVGRYPLEYLATGADFWATHDGGLELSIVGYTQEEQAYITRFKLTKAQLQNTSYPPFLTKGEATKYYLGPGKEVGQVEGLCYDLDGKMWISAEAYDYDPPLPQAIMEIKN